MILFNKPYLSEKEIDNIKIASQGNKLSGDGPFTKKCHSWLEENIKTKKAFLTNSCTAALEMSAILCELGAGDEVIMPSFTFVSTANAYVLRGATPVFVDIRPDTQNIDETLIEASITEKTKAIVVVHYAGVSCEMDTIMAIAKKHNLVVIEDAAQAALSTYKGKPLGSIGHLAAFSFHDTKNFISGEGGALLINDDRFIERAHIIWEKGTNRKQFIDGIVDKYSWVDIGSSFLPSEITAAVLSAQFDYSNEIKKYRVDLFNQYYKKLSELEKDGFVSLPSIPLDTSHNGHMFYILCKNKSDRSLLIEYLRNNKIQSVFHYIPLHSSPAGLKYGKILQKSLPVTDKTSDRLLRLPMFNDLKLNNVSNVCSKIIEYYRSSF